MMVDEVHLLFPDLFISHIKVKVSYDLHKNFYQYLLHQDQLKEFFSKSGHINKPHRSRLTARNLEITTLLTCDLKTSLSGFFYESKNTVFKLTKNIIQQTTVITKDNLKTNKILNLLRFPN
ncbi:hypothetical protein BpHYR1_013674 [Brachionus plicatilis]|uniref:Uncharacterized protein n=1 Tax=Brachionus plicatilis TaxID=10195 RepID=A0A3M7SXB4_BRAPC|nr:hypothetical protein BpHYR1_013674 [Brachionus plicatilis]